MAGGCQPAAHDAQPAVAQHGSAPLSSRVSLTGRRTQSAHLVARRAGADRQAVGGRSPPTCPQGDVCCSPGRRAPIDRLWKRFLRAWGGLVVAQTRCSCSRVRGPCSAPALPTPTRQLHTRPSWPGGCGLLHWALASLRLPGRPLGGVPFTRSPALRAQVRCQRHHGQWLSGPQSGGRGSLTRKWLFFKTSPTRSEAIPPPRTITKPGTPAPGVPPRLPLWAQASQSWPGWPHRG